MKTLKHITLLVIALIAASSCTTDEYYNDTNEEKWFVDDFEVLGSHWKLVGKPNEIGSYYECIFNKVPLEVSYYEGIVTAYLYFDYKSEYEIQTPLPYTEYKMYVDGITGKEVYYSIQYTYDVKADGTIAFKAYVSDYFTKDFRPGTQHFKVAIVW